MTAPIHTAGVRRPWEHRPSADKLGNAPHVYGRLVPLETPRRSLLSRLLGRGA